MSYDEQELLQYQKRHNSTAPIYGPNGRNPNVMRTSETEIPFKDSTSALRYAKSIGTKTPDARVIQARSHSRFISRGDD